MSINKISIFVCSQSIESDNVMQKEVFKTLIKEGQEEIRDMDLFERPFEFEEQGRYVLVGVRQAGKSYLLYQRARQL